MQWVVRSQIGRGCVWRAGVEGWGLKNRKSDAASIVTARACWERFPDSGTEVN